MLLTNGCSFVWGDELDGYNDDPPTHQRHTFTFKLASHLGMPSVNLGTCGACNHKIFRDTVDYLSENKGEVSHIVILWSAWQRDEIVENYSPEQEEELRIQRWNSLTQISHERVHNVKDKYRDVVSAYHKGPYGMRNGMIKTMTYMKHMQFLCDALDIKIIQGVFHERMYQNFLSTMSPKNRKIHYGPWMDYMKDGLNSLRDECKIGMGTYTDLYSLAVSKYTIKEFSHPDEEANSEYARLLHHIYKTIEKRDA